MRRQRIERVEQMVTTYVCDGPNHAIEEMESCPIEVRGHYGSTEIDGTELHFCTIDCMTAWGLAFKEGKIKLSRYDQHLL